MVRSIRTPPASIAAVRARMQAQRRRDTVPEMALRRVLHGLGLRYRLDLNVVPRTRRTVDIDFGPSKVAVFVDGCFWHGCGAHRGQVPKVNQQFWREKIRENVARDRDTAHAGGFGRCTCLGARQHGRCCTPD